MTISVHNEIVPDLVTQDVCLPAKARQGFCGTVAKQLVKKFPFMKDSGISVTGYVLNDNI